MQNKPNLKNTKIGISSFVTSKYEILSGWRGKKTKPIQSQFKPNLSQNKANLSQFQSQTNPIVQGSHNKAIFLDGKVYNLV
ncbi:MAG: hypothetical protein H8D56_24905 [Planctomycetes bacterium]|nr:hypothetical protein [Planctomycetota bacterium]